MVSIDSVYYKDNTIVLLTHINSSSIPLVTNKLDRLHILNMLKNQTPLLWIYSSTGVFKKCLLLRNRICIATFSSDHTGLALDKRYLTTPILYITTPWSIEGIHLETYESIILLDYKKLSHQYNAMDLLQNTHRLIVYGNDYYVVYSTSGHIAFGQFSNITTFKIFQLRPEEKVGDFVSFALFGSILGIGFTSGIVIFWDILEHMVHKNFFIPSDEYKTYASSPEFTSSLFKLVFYNQTELRFYCYDNSYISWKLKNIDL